jgi:hypothetical protein
MNMLKLFLHWCNKYLAEEFLATQLECASSLIGIVTKFVLETFLEEFDHKNPVILIPPRKIRDQKSIIIFKSDGKPIRLSAIVDGSHQEIEMPAGKGKYVW